jgi:hypothetical protein
MSGCLCLSFLSLLQLNEVVVMYLLGTLSMSSLLLLSSLEVVHSRIKDGIILVLNLCRVEILEYLLDNLYCFGV